MPRLRFDGGMEMSGQRDSVNRMPDASWVWIEGQLAASSGPRAPFVARYSGQQGVRAFGRVIGRDLLMSEKVTWLVRQDYIFRYVQVCAMVSLLSQCGLQIGLVAISWRLGAGVLALVAFLPIFRTGIQLVQAESRVVCRLGPVVLWSLRLERITCVIDDLAASQG